MPKYRARFAMDIIFDAEDLDDAKEKFESISLDTAEFVELEDISRYD